MSNRSALSWRRGLHTSHRYLGLAATAFVVVLAATGLMLNHTESLGLDSQRVDAPWLMAWYGMELPAQRVSYQTGGHHVSQIGPQLYLDGEPLAERADGQLVGAVFTDPIVALADRSSLTLYTQDGQQVERLTAVHGLPTPIEAVGRGPAGQVAVRTADDVYVGDEALLTWRTQAEAADVAWAAPRDVPAALLAQYRGHGPTLERILLDLHSGRILGAAGVLLMDAAAVIFLILAGLGVWLWALRRR